MKSLIKILLPKKIRDRIIRIKRQFEFQKIKLQSPTITKETLRKDLTALGIQDGDLVFVHSSLRSLGFVQGGPDAVIDAFLEAIGPEGTLAFPTFTLLPGMKQTLESDDYVFDPATTPSTVGKITDIFRARPGVIRSEHPTHSVAAYGKRAVELTETHLEEGMNFGRGTPFERLIDYDAKIVGLGVDFSPITLYHTFEDFNLDRFPDVYIPRKFKSRIKRGDQIIEVWVRCHNPEFRKQRIDLTPEIESFFASYYKSEGVVHLGKLGRSTTWWIRAKDVMQCLEKLYKNGITIYRTPNLSD